ncbi:FAD-binding and (Fe-S)-binding domain-containing protein [Aureitalea marina]|uniref:FAD-binding oxidoreductase n=1 Tax=Aureitalea marina TaxID=930804 RepID=A0A2S7KP13_9FLAO|nr:FAD-binding and (Fe-S)-binding domain-containing protein [Aureitalea marina]PQB04366.1 FAD-binding oxidoreductase [Aureitalea marina]
MQDALIALKDSLTGELHWDELHQMMYATDASVYRKIPLAVAYPKNALDLKLLVAFALDHKTSLTPRTAGTSLAGQCVGEGIIVDTSRYMNKILELDLKERRVRVQPGVIRDELNDYLRPHGLFFGPNTSTSSRCMIGGMVGNNSSGTTSIRYGVTRDKVIALKTVLSDGGEYVFQELGPEEVAIKMNTDGLEGRLYSGIHQLLSPVQVREEIRQEFPNPQIHRRNTGYAIDKLIDSNLFETQGRNLNLCELLCGSEGTLSLTTEITLQLDPLAPDRVRMIAAHYNSLELALKDVQLAMNHPLHTCELMDDVILDCTKGNTLYQGMRAFVQGNPKAILMLELKADTDKEADRLAGALEKDLIQSASAYHLATLKDETIDHALELRKAGLGLLGNLIGDKKAVACIEDTAVTLEDLPAFIGEFTQLMDHYGQKAVYYAHAGAGELHLRPILNLKKQKDVGLFSEITLEVAKLTKKYRGSFSGEHGDGIVRSSMIPLMIGDKNYEVLRQIKQLFDPNGIFNPGKIIDPWPMDLALRYTPERKEPQIKTLMNFDPEGGLLRLAEKCNGSGDCRKTAQASGMMCPSYRATLDEKDTTRARANVLREVLTGLEEDKLLASNELHEAMQLCLGCKACLTECPSTVDVASARSEFLYQYQQEKGYRLKDRLIAYSSRVNRIGSKWPSLVNFLYGNELFSGMIKRVAGMAPERTLPFLSKPSFDQWYKRSSNNHQGEGQLVILIVDEFSNYLDAHVAKDALKLLVGLGYCVQVMYMDSARALISKGFLEQAKIQVDMNIAELSPHLQEETPILGLEPSAILGFRDEYKRLATDRGQALRLADQVFLIEEFLVDQFQKGKIKSDQFTQTPQLVKIHVHCHQKSLSNQKVTFDLLNIPINYKPTLIPSGCCGMAGSFGFEKENYAISMTIAEHKLLPSVRKLEPNTLIAANGTSCRHQIKDGAGVEALHPVSILVNALI